MSAPAGVATRPSPPSKQLVGPVVGPPPVGRTVEQPLGPLVGPPVEQPVESPVERPRSRQPVGQPVGSLVASTDWPPTPLVPRAHTGEALGRTVEQSVEPVGQPVLSAPTVSSKAPLVLRAHTGEALVLDRARWHAPATAEERALLSTVSGPAIDLGCGPGRVVLSLADEGVAALGVDSSPAAVALARRRGAAVLEGDVFGPLPHEGRWATCILFDGTIGIGGDPTRLLARCRQLTGPGGRVIAEVEPPGTGWRHFTAWLEGGGRRSPAFAWAVVGADAVADVARPAGFGLTSLAHTPSGRWFADLHAATSP